LAGKKRPRTNKQKFVPTDLEKNLFEDTKQKVFRVQNFKAGFFLSIKDTGVSVSLPTCQLIFDAISVALQTFLF
jgi:hypothetical protein